MPSPAYRIFLLSPASCHGERARLLLNPRARFELALRLRTPAGAAIGEVFSFLSGLYFRGKLTYANHFAHPPAGCAGVQIITTDRGLVAADTPVTLDDLERMAPVPIDLDEPKYTCPLRRSIRKLASLGDACQFVLLGSIATPKYVTILSEGLGGSLLYPTDFAGRGDMSRGGLLLRCVREGRELTYTPITGTHHGTRPPKLKTGN
jgi:hypothetical protein